MELGLRRCEALGQQSPGGREAPGTPEPLGGKQSQERSEVTVKASTHVTMKEKIQFMWTLRSQMLGMAGRGGWRRDRWIGEVRSRLGSRLLLQQAGHPPPAEPWSNLLHSLPTSQGTWGEAA